MAGVERYRKEQNGEYPTKFSEIFTQKDVTAPTDRFAVFPSTNEKSHDYPTWESLAAAIDGGELEGEYHYLGAGLPLDADPRTVIILCDSIPTENGLDVVIVGLADGSSIKVEGAKATELKRNFKRGKTPLVLDDNAP